MMKNELDELIKINPSKFKLNYIVTRFYKDWDGLKGHVDKQ